MYTFVIHDVLTQVPTKIVKFMVGYGHDIIQTQQKIGKLSNIKSIMGSVN